MKEIHIVLQVDTDEPDDFVEFDLKDEISCCTLSYEIKDVTIKDIQL